MTDKPAGWYTDPSGMPNMFRWWNGQQWTTTLTSDPSAPAPASPSAVTPPSSSGGESGGDSGGAPAGSSSTEQATEPISRPQQPSEGGQAPSGPAGQSPQAGQPDQTGQPTQQMAPVQPGQPAQSGQPGLFAQPGQSGQPGQGPGQGQPSPFAPPGAHGPFPQYGQQQQPPPGQGGQRPPILPPPGAPGPGYVPPPYDPMHQYTEVLSSDPGGNGRNNRTGLIIGGIGLAVVLIAVVLGGFWWVNRDKDTPTAADDNTTQQPTPEQTDPEQPQPTPEESFPSTPGPQRTQPPDEQNTPGPTNAPLAGRLTFTPLAKPWKSSDALSQDLLLSTAQTYVTEPKWDGQTDWVALASAGYASPEWVGQDAKQTAGNIAEWFATTNFNNANVGRQPLGSSKIKVGQYDATVLKEHFTYNISGLKAKGETVSIVVVDIKGAPVPGVFLGSVPDTNKGLQNDVQKAIDSLKVES